jgi:NADPH2:quinone reductase
MNSKIEILNSVYAINADYSEFSFIETKEFLKEIGDDEVLVKHEYIGFNHYDLDLIRNFKKNKAVNPKIFKKKIFIPGIEAIGKVKGFGKNVNEFNLNDRVLYVTSKNGGGYGEYNIVSKNLLISPPDEIPSKDALTIASRGIMAHNLLKKVYVCKSGETVLLITNPLGALGHIIAQIARFLDLKIIACVENDESGKKKQICEKLGYFDLIVEIDKKETLFDKIMEFTNGYGIHLVIDTIGGPNLKRLLESMLYCGVFVSLGQNSGIDLSVNLRLLQNKSIFLTRPSIFDYKSYVHELRLTAFEIFSLYLSGDLKPKINKIYKFNELENLIDDAEKRKIRFMNLIKV